MDDILEFGRDAGRDAFACDFSQPAWAEKPDDDGYRAADRHPDTMTVAPALLYLPNLDTAITALAKDPMFDGLPVDWTGLLNFYADNGGLALFTTPTGLSELGQRFHDRLPLAAGCRPQGAADRSGCCRHRADPDLARQPGAGRSASWPRSSSARLSMPPPFWR